MRIYLAGPMRGIPFFNFPTFDLGQLWLEERGYEVCNPAQIDRDAGFDETVCPTGFELDNVDFRAILRRDIDALSRCDGLALLPGFHQSKGCKMELAAADFIGIAVVAIIPKADLTLLKAEVKMEGVE